MLLNFKIRHLKKNLTRKILLIPACFLLWQNFGFSQLLLKESGSQNQILNLSTYPFTPTSDPFNWNFSQGSAQDNRNDISSGSNSLRTQIQDFAYRFLGKRYRSSGKSPKTGFDCSGFTGYIFRNFGYHLKSSSIAQATEGRKVPIHKATVGDLAFFGHKGRKGRFRVNHAAIVISKPGEPLAIIHSASNKGIVITKVESSRYWKNSLLFVKNVINK